MKHSLMLSIVLALVVTAVITASVGNVGKNIKCEIKNLKVAFYNIYFSIPLIENNY